MPASWSCTVNNASYGFTAASAQHLQMTPDPGHRGRALGRSTAPSPASARSSIPRGVSCRRPSCSVPLSCGAPSGPPTNARGTSGWGTGSPGSCSCFPRSCCSRCPRRRAAARRPAPGCVPEGARALVILPTYDERATIEQVLNGVRAAPQDVDILVVDDSSPDGTARCGPRSDGLADPHIRLGGAPRQVRARRRLPGRLPPWPSRGVRPDRRDGLGPVPRPGGARRASSTAAARRTTSSWARRYVPGRLGVELEPRAGRPVPRRQPVRPPDARDPRCTTPRAATASTAAGLLADLIAGPFASDGYGFQIELVMRAVGPRVRGRRGADHVPRARARAIEDLPAHRRRSAVARHDLGRPRGASTRRALDPELRRRDRPIMYPMRTCPRRPAEVVAAAIDARPCSGRRRRAPASVGRILDDPSEASGAGGAGLVEPANGRRERRLVQQLRIGSAPRRQPGGRRPRARRASPWTRSRWARSSSLRRPPAGSTPSMGGSRGRSGASRRPSPGRPSSRFRVSAVDTNSCIGGVSG